MYIIAPVTDCVKGFCERLSASDLPTFVVLRDRGEPEAQVLRDFVAGLTADDLAHPVSNKATKGCRLRTCCGA